jgi:hypothetical protein
MRTGSEDEDEDEDEDDKIVWRVPIHVRTGRVGARGSLRLGFGAIHCGVCACVDDEIGPLRLNRADDGLRIANVQLRATARQQAPVPARFSAGHVQLAHWPR